MPTLKHDFTLANGLWYFIKRRAWRILPPYYFALAISIIALAETIKELTSSSSPTTHVPFDEGYGTGIDDMLHRVPCVDKVRDTIGWVPERTLDEILADVVASLRVRTFLAAA